MYMSIFFLFFCCLASHLLCMLGEPRSRQNVSQLHLASLMFSLNSGHQADEQACTPACSLDDSCLRGGMKAVGVEQKERKTQCNVSDSKALLFACAWMTPMRPDAPVEVVIQRLTANTGWKSQP